MDSSRVKQVMRVSKVKVDVEGRETDLRERHIHRRMGQREGSKLQCILHLHLPASSNSRLHLVDASSFP